MFMQFMPCLLRGPCQGILLNSMNSQRNPCLKAGLIANTGVIAATNRPVWGQFNVNADMRKNRFSEYNFSKIIEINFVGI